MATSPILTPAGCSTTSWPQPEEAYVDTNADEQTFQLNAWTGQETAQGSLSTNIAGWMHANRPAKPDTDFRPQVAALENWRKAGWGVILPYREGVSEQQQALATDAP